MNRRPNNQQGSGQSNDRNRSRRRRGGGGGGGGAQQGGGGPRPNKQDAQSNQQIEVTKKGPPVLRRYAVLFYENHAQAREDVPNLQTKATEVDQLNIVIRAEGSMDDPELLKFGKLFAGEAWHLIHRRRVDDKWYDDPHE